MLAYHVGPDVAERLATSLPRSPYEGETDWRLIVCIQTHVLVGTETVYIYGKNPPPDFVEASTGFPFKQRNWR